MLESEHCCWGPVASAHAEGPIANETTSKAMRVRIVRDITPPRRYVRGSQQKRS